MSFNFVNKNMSLFPKKIHQTLFYFGILLLAVSLPLSKFGMSLGMLVLSANWLLEGNLKQKINLFLKNKPALVIASIFVIHVIWLINTSNFKYGLDDLRTKVPILALAIVMSTTPCIDFKKFKTVLFVHIGAVIAASLVGIFIYITQNIVEIRHISPFISHIRLSLNICIAIFSLVYFLIFDYNFRLFVKIGFAIIIAWLLFFLFILQSMTGILIIIIVSFCLLLHFSIKVKRNPALKYSLFSLLILTPALLLYLSYLTVSDYFTPISTQANKLYDTTAYGSPYIHDTIHMPIENGRWVGLNMCLPELMNAWEERSSIPFYNDDSSGQDIRITLIRYLNSKGLRKDYQGVHQLTDVDIKNIENGIANYKYTKFFSLKTRLYKLLWEYQNYKMNGDIQGHSIIQRIELWSVSLDLIKKNFFWGTGTGDLPDVFKDELTQRNSPLKETRMRSHNQFLSIFVAFGIFGVLWFIFALLYPMLKTKKYTDYFFIVFFIVLFLSMLTEDTIEPQDGLSLFAFFYTFFIFQRPKSENFSL